MKRKINTDPLPDGWYYAYWKDGKIHVDSKKFRITPPWALEQFENILKVDEWSGYIEFDCGVIATSIDDDTCKQLMKKIGCGAGPARA